MKLYIVLAWLILYHVCLWGSIMRFTWQHRRDTWTGATWAETRSVLKERAMETMRLLVAMAAMTLVYAAGLVALSVLP